MMEIAIFIVAYIVAYGICIAALNYTDLDTEMKIVTSLIWPITLAIFAGVFITVAIMWVLAGIQRIINEKR